MRKGARRCATLARFLLAIKVVKGGLKVTVMQAKRYVGRGERVHRCLMRGAAERVVSWRWE